MNNIINLCATLVLTMLGFVIPILTIFLSIFHEGAKALSLKYQAEKKQSDDNIANELKKKETGNDFDYSSLEKTLKILKKNKKIAEDRLSYLKPAKLVIKISTPLVITFVCLLILFKELSLLVTILFISISIVAFYYSLYVMWKSLVVLIEVTEIISETKKNSEEKVIELLSRLVDRDAGNSLFLDSQNIDIKFDNTKLIEGGNFKFPINTNRSIPISINNSSDIMGKNIEIGFIFPSDFLVEKTSNIASIYTAETQQIIRFRQEYVRGKENNLQGNMKVTFLKAGKHQITAFIKGENFKNKYIKFEIEVIS